MLWTVWAFILIGSEWCVWLVSCFIIENVLQINVLKELVKAVKASLCHTVTLVTIDEASNLKLQSIFSESCTSFITVVFVWGVGFAFSCTPCIQARYLYIQTRDWGHFDILDTKT